MAEQTFLLHHVLGTHCFVDVGARCEGMVHQVMFWIFWRIALCQRWDQFFPIVLDEYLNDYWWHYEIDGNAVKTQMCIISHYSRPLLVHKKTGVILNYLFSVRKALDSKFHQLTIWETFRLSDLSGAFCLELVLYRIHIDLNTASESSNA